MLWQVGLLRSKPAGLLRRSFCLCRLLLVLWGSLHMHSKGVLTWSGAMHSHL